MWRFHVENEHYKLATCMLLSVKRFKLKVGKQFVDNQVELFSLA